MASIEVKQNSCWAHAGSGVNLTSDTDKPRPPAHDITAPPAVVGGRNVS